MSKSQSSSKRRKTSRSYGPMEPQSTNHHYKDMRVSWPPGKIPVEIFRIIISFLSRSTIQQMRLVDKEFEEKISEDLFRTVVVPFRPEIYGIASQSIRPDWLNLIAKSKHQGDLQGKAAVMLQDKGMRVFQGFGRHIHRFAMSFELDYDILMQPPLKSDQEAITTFWGIYRWPFKNYNRFAQLEGLEQTADETMTMTKALGFISNAKELALSIDGGLGWLSGPDKNQQAASSHETIKVFGESRFPADEYQNTRGAVRPRQPKSSQARKQSHKATKGNPETRTEVYQEEPGCPVPIERMLREAGYEGESLSQSIRMLMDSEGLLLSSEKISSMNSSSEAHTLSPYISQVPHALHDESLLIPQDGHGSVEPDVGTSTTGDAEIKCSCPLKPNDLSNAQKEMLLETEWAQRAFMQSYAIAIIDNPLTFRNVETLTIARLPSRHLPILCRVDFWNSLSQLAKVSLSVIPDWREVTKLPTSWVDDVRIPPSQAIRIVHQLLIDYISHRKSIKVIHFEWLCGGEGAPGIFARNQLILAAPVLSQAIDMVTGTSEVPSVLLLPHVEHLSLKNCWLSPHILLHFITSLKATKLRTLKLDSVSLTAPIVRDGQPGPANFHAPHHPAHPIQLHMNFVAPLLAGPLHHMVTGSSSWLNAPRSGSWTDIVDRCSPGPTLASLRYAQDIGPEPPARKPSQLKRITFRSCGYVRLPLDIDQSMLEPPEPQPGELTGVAKRRNEIEGFMMKPLEHTLGTIINYIDRDECRTLEFAWNLRLGWENIDRSVSVESHADGVRFPGRGRFGGDIITGSPIKGHVDGMAGCDG